MTKLFHCFITPMVLPSDPNETIKQQLVLFALQKQQLANKIKLLNNIIKEPLNVRN